MERIKLQFSYQLLNIELDYCTYYITINPIHLIYYKGKKFCLRFLFISKFSPIKFSDSETQLPTDYIVTHGQMVTIQRVGSCLSRTTILQRNLFIRSELKHGWLCRCLRSAKDRSFADRFSSRWNVSHS